MNIVNLIAERVATFVQASQSFESLNQFATQFQQAWIKTGRDLQQQLLQEKIHQIELQHSGCRQIRTHRYHTPLGTIELKRRIYDTAQGRECIADKVLGLPQTPWLPAVLELASALGVGSEFPTAQNLFERWSGVALREKTLANQVEAAGERLQNSEFDQAPGETAALDSVLSQAILCVKPKPRVYVGVDGVMTPLNQAQGYKEALVGVLFKESDHWRVSPKRAEIRTRQYIATLKPRQAFQERVYQLYTQVVGQTPHETVVLGDGAKWIWQMAQDYFPNCVQILDFFHVCEYVWSVARAAWPQQESQQKAWVECQQELLKQSRWHSVVAESRQLPGFSNDLKQAVDDLERYLSNNQTRVDYRRYLKQGLMIGSGVVESSNRRVVTQRLKQAGMHWSKYGAEGVMALRACYLSDSDRWQNFWNSFAA